MSMLGAHHLLIKFSGSRNPVSRRTNQSTSNISLEDAKAELAQYRQKIMDLGGTEDAFMK